MVERAARAHADGFRDVARGGGIEAFSTNSFAAARNSSARRLGSSPVSALRRGIVLQCCCDARALVDGAFGIQFGGDVGTADQRHRNAGCFQRGLQLAARFLPGQRRRWCRRDRVFASPPTEMCRPASSMRS